MRNAYGVLNNREKIYSIFFKSVCGLIIFGTVIWNLSELLQISVINDEFGYWGIAAYFRGMIGQDYLELHHIMDMA